MILPESTVCIWTASVGKHVPVQWTKMPLPFLRTSVEVPPCSRTWRDRAALDGTGRVTGVAYKCHDSQFSYTCLMIRDPSNWASSQDPCTDGILDLAPHSQTLITIYILKKKRLIMTPVLGIPGIRKGSQELDLRDPLRGSMGSRQHLEFLSFLWCSWGRGIWDERLLSQVRFSTAQGGSCAGTHRG